MHEEVCNLRSESINVTKQQQEQKLITQDVKLKEQAVHKVYNFVFDLRLNWTSVLLEVLSQHYVRTDVLKTIFFTKFHQLGTLSQLICNASCNVDTGLWSALQLFPPEPLPTSFCCIRPTCYIHQDHSLLLLCLCVRKQRFLAEDSSLKSNNTVY